MNEIPVPNTETKEITPPSLNHLQFKQKADLLTQLPKLS